jgi:DNA-binding protein YbaB
MSELASESMAQRRREAPAERREDVSWTLDQEMASVRAAVAEAERRTAEAAERARARASTIIREKVEPGLGTVSVTGLGELLAVDLDPREMAWTTPSALAQAVTSAIQRAERRVNRMEANRA